MSKKENTEKRLLRISLFGSALFALIELAMAMISKSQSVIADTLYDMAELVVILASLLITPLLYRPVSEKHPFGYSQLESLFIIVRGFMLLAVTLSMVVVNVQLIVAGGNQIDSTLVAAFELGLAAICLTVYLTLKRYSKKFHSPTIETELYTWKVDTVFSFAVAAVFIVPALLRGTVFEPWCRYFDPAVSILISLLMLPTPIRMLVRSFRSLLLFATADTLAQVKEIAQPICDNYGFDIDFIDFVETGRQVWIDFTLGGSEVWRLDEMRRLEDELTRALGKKYDNATVTLIPELETAAQ